jgi:hypothetical protein
LLFFEENMFVITGNLGVPVRSLVTVLQHVPLKTSSLQGKRNRAGF